MVEDLKQIYFLLVLFGAFYAITSLEAGADEPVCPNFEFEQKLLDSYTRLEQTVAAMKDGIIQTLKPSGADETNEEKAAFTAFLDHMEDYASEETLIFNNIVYNFNNGYNAKTGIFTARTTGTYIFSFQIEHWETPELPVHLMVDNVRQVSTIIYTSSRSTQSGNTAVLGLKQGQSVWIQTGKSGQLYGSDTFRGTTFSGAFLY